MASILVIDDDKQVRTLLRRVLEQEGYRGSSKLVMAVKASTAAVEMPIDVVITDIFMDQQEGLATIRVLHREFPEIKVIAITGGIGDFLEDAKAFGAGWAFTKPLALDQFLAAVREAFARPLAPSGHPSPG